MMKIKVSKTTTIFHMILGLVFSSYSYEMVFIPAKDSSFVMGAYEVGKIADVEEELPVHNVSFSYDFMIGNKEITNDLYFKVMKEEYTDFIRHIPKKKNHDISPEVPVMNMGYGNAILFCNALSKRENLDPVYGYNKVKGKIGKTSMTLQGVHVDFSKNGYRLPTEAEWEYVCRAGTKTAYFWGNFNDYPTADEYGWVNPITLDETPQERSLHFGGRKKPNPFGVYDIIGNVAEMCHQVEDYDTTTLKDPPITSWFITRGGNVESNMYDYTSSSRGTSSYYDYDGIRLIRRVNTSDSIDSHDKLSKSSKEQPLIQPQVLAHYNPLYWYKPNKRKPLSGELVIETKGIRVIYEVKERG